MKRVLGIDPGLSGAFCVYAMHPDGSKELSFLSFPTIENEIDFQKLTEYFGCFHDCRAVIEKVTAMPKQGVSSMFKFGRVFGSLQACLHNFKIEHVEVTPQAWQKEIHAGVSKELDAKKRSLLIAKRLFPNETFLATERSRVPHDGFVDAALIAEYGRRKFFQ